jgi:hypothetical protein
MTELNQSTVHRTSETPSYSRPEEIQQMFGIKKIAYYNRLKFLGIEAHKDSEGKPYLDSEQMELLKAFHEHINETGKMEGFNGSALVKVNDSKLTQSTENNLPEKSEDIYIKPEEPTANFDVNNLMRSAAELKAREIAMPALVKRAIADQMEEDDLPEDLQEKVNLAREAANPKFTPTEVASNLLNQWRATKGG